MDWPASLLRIEAFLFAIPNLEEGITVGSYSVTSWYVDGKEFKLRGKKTKTIKTVWGTYKFDAFGKYEKIED